MSNDFMQKSLIRKLNAEIVQDIVNSIVKVEDINDFEFKNDMKLIIAAILIGVFYFCLI